MLAKDFCLEVVSQLLQECEQQLTLTKSSITGKSKYSKAVAGFSAPQVMLATH